MSAEVKAAIQRSMASGRPFTFQSLCLAHRNADWHVVDREIQRWRKRGWIAFERVGRQTIWSVTEKGRREISA